MLLKSDLDAQQKPTPCQKFMQLLTAETGLLKKLMLSSISVSGQIPDWQRYDFGHTALLLKLDLDVQQNQLRGHFVEHKTHA